MKFFKYFIFILLSFLSINAFAVTYEYRAFNSVISGDWLTSPELACKNFIAKWASSAPYVRSSEVECVYKTTDGDRGAQIEKREATCKAGASNVYSGSVTIQNWKDDNEWLNLNDAMLAKFNGTTVCANSCIHKFDFLGDSTGDAVNGPVTFKGKYVSTDTQCTSPTQGPVDTLNGTKTPSSDGCKNGEAYCDKPPSGCPSGYTSGSFNGKQICVKNNPDPTKPNPNDPNNGGGKGEGSCNGTNNCNTTKLDDTNIVNAINSSKTAITQAISSLSESISTAFTTVTDAINGTTNAVNNNTNAVNAVKSSVDALHNTINAVTTAVNNNTNAVTSAVHANTSATNAVKASVDALNSTVSAVTTAVNVNGDKVTKAVNDNTTATNAVKSAVDNLNSAVNAVSDAVNANGKNTVDAVNANGKNTVDAVNKGIEATKENGKKLDGIQTSVDEGNGLIKDIKDWLTKEPTLENGQLEINNEVLPGYERKDYVQFTNTCPFASEEVNLPMGVLGSITFTKDLTFVCSYALDARPYIIALGYFGALIYLLYGLRSRNG